MRIDLWLINNILSLTFFSIEIPVTVFSDDTPWEPVEACEMQGRLELSDRSYRGCCSGHSGMLRPYEERGLACCTKDKEVICDDGWHSDCYCPDEFDIVEIRWRQ